MRIEMYNRIVDGDQITMQRIGVTEKATDITLTDTLYGQGDFDFTMALGAPYSDVIEIGTIIRADGYYWGVVTGTVRQESAGGATVEATGLELKAWLASSRIVVPKDYTSTDGTAGYDTANGYTDAVVKHFWDNNLIAPTQVPRKIPGVVWAGDDNIGIADDKYMSRFESLADVTAELCEAAKIGYRAEIDVDTGIITVGCFAGVDRTETQAKASRAIFSISRGNISDISYDLDRAGYANAFYTTRSGAEFADEALTMLYFRDDMEVSGWDRRETWNEISVPEPVSGTEYDEMKKQAEKKMESAKEDESYTCSILRNAGYRTRWNVGDTVTVKWEREGVTADMQVTEVSTSQDDNGTDYTVKFGDAKPKIISVRRRIIMI